MAPPAQYNHCKTVYSAMEADSHEEKIEGQMVRVWIGHSTKLFSELGMPVPYYTSVMHKLQAMQSVIQLHRGGGAGESKWALLNPPTRELFDNSKDRVTGRPTSKDSFNQRMRDMQRSIQTYQSEADQLFAEINLRLDMAETQLKALAEEVRKVNARFND
jgi:hypothetical protein